MGVGKLNVYITSLGQPCKVDNERWVVAIAHCDGNILNWSEGRYRTKTDDAWTRIAKHRPPAASGTPSLPDGWWYDSIPAENGHVEIEVPPGCYVITASKHTWTGIVYDQGFAKWALYGNWATDHAIVNVHSDEDVCATLYSPTVQPCWKRLFDFVIPMAIRSLQKQKLLKAEDAKSVQDAAKVLDERLFKPLIAQGVTPFEERDLEHLRRTFQGLTKLQETTKT